MWQPRLTSLDKETSADCYNIVARAHEGGAEWQHALNTDNRHATDGIATIRCDGNCESGKGHYPLCCDSADWQHALDTDNLHAADGLATIRCDRNCDRGKDIIGHGGMPDVSRHRYT